MDNEPELLIVIYRQNKIDMGWGGSGSKISFKISFSTNRSINLWYLRYCLFLKKVIGDTVYILLIFIKDYSWP